MDEMRMMDEMLGRPGEEILEGAWQHIAQRHGRPAQPGRYEPGDLEAMIIIDETQQAFMPLYPFTGLKPAN